jgi:hypothetical protein
MLPPLVPAEDCHYSRLFPKQRVTREQHSIVGR